ncbi:MAG: metallophosphoesterase [Planctomycetaceae bacterium]|jgi:DNA repair exonuclease SbcCD nuclease subunit|nr:metallophosphoesterase [Planctomycetaceae bacterium]
MFSSKILVRIPAAAFLCLSCFVLILPEQAVSGQETLTLVQLCDPQFGFGTDGIAADKQRFKQAIRQINALKPDAVLIAGDFVNEINDEKSVIEFNEMLKSIRFPVVLTAGNHDLPDPVTPEGLQRYRSRYGEDFQTMECKGYLIISANSQLWRAAPKEESGQHQQKLQKSLQGAKTQGKPVILMTHVPPFVKSPDEKDGYYNLPNKQRTEILRLCEENGVIFWLAGHTHRTARRNYNSIAILNGETTSRNADKRPAGYRVLTIKPDRSFEWDFVPLETVP